MSAWLAAFARPGQVRGAVLEDPPLFSTEAKPAVGASILQAIGPGSGSAQVARRSGPSGTSPA